eukprot:scaffold91909_cov33-Prasinocladus_malaysianus.AAC.1
MAKLRPWLLGVFSQIRAERNRNPANCHSSFWWHRRVLPLQQQVSNPPTEAVKAVLVGLKSDKLELSERNTHKMT